MGFGFLGLSVLGLLELLGYWDRGSWILYLQGLHAYDNLKSRTNFFF